jgi:hypothetical protein
MQQTAKEKLWRIYDTLLLTNSLGKHFYAQYKAVVPP